MTRGKGGLGRGLAALIPTGPQTNVVSDVLMGGSAIRLDAQPHRGGTSPTAQTLAPSSLTTANGRTTHSDDLGSASAPVRTGEKENFSSATTNTAATAGDPSDTNGSPVRESVGQSTNDGPRYEEVAISKIRRNPHNPRTVFDQEALSELAHSLREFGLLQPIVVRPVDQGYELVMGERRWRAAEQAGMVTIPAIIRRTEDANLLRDALLENIHRANLNPLEEAAAYQQLLQEFDVTQDELAQRLGRSRPVISNTIRLLKLPVPVQRRVAAGVLSAGHARALLSIEDPERQEELATRVVAEGLSVRGTEEAVVLMVGRPTKRRRALPEKMVLPRLSALAGTLSDTFDTRVRVEMGRQKGRVIVEFATADDLERIVGIMAPAAVNARPGRSVEIDPV